MLKGECLWDPRLGSLRSSNSGRSEEVSESLELAAKVAQQGGHCARLNFAVSQVPSELAGHEVNIKLVWHS